MLSTYIPDFDEIKYDSLADFDNTFNFVINTRAKDFDWFNNPYITPNIYELDESWIPRLLTNA